MTAIYKNIKMFLKKIANRKPFVIFLKLRGKIYAKKERNVSELRKLQIERETKHLSLSVAELFMQENATDGFNRYDMIVRLLAIECEKGINDFGWDFYRRMQKARVGDDRLEDRVIRFKNLIKSYDEGGYDTSSEIELDCNLHLIDGSHRMAMALYHHIPMINVKVRPNKHDCFYGIEFFRINDFSDAECNIIQNRYKEVLDTGINQVFVCSLWHPVRNYFEEITKHLEIFGKVVSVKDFILSEQDYKFYTKAIYYVDDIEDWKVEKKIEYMMSDSSQNYYLRMVAIELLNPKFRLKASTNGTLSQRCEFVKRLIRNAYRNKIDNYFHDIILHIGDNFYQNRFIYNLMNMPHIDVKTILSNINNYNYVITKSETDYMPSDFPVHYPLGKDIDIICAGMNEYEKILAIVKQDVEKYWGAYNIRMVDKKDENGVVYRTLLRLEQEDKLIFQFDIACRTGKLSEEFSIELCNGRILKQGYYVPEISKELIVRLYEIEEHPEKVHHVKYIKEHLSDLDDNICAKYITDNILGILVKIKSDTIDVRIN